MSEAVVIARVPPVLRAGRAGCGDGRHPLHPPVRDRRRDAGLMPLRIHVVRTIGLAIIAVPLFAAIGESAARGLADATAFHKRPWTTEQAWLRIRGWHSYRSSRYAIVHPFGSGESVDLPLSRAEYDRLVADQSDAWTYGYCYPVRLDRVGRAVRLHFPAPISAGTVRPCGASASDIQ